MNRTAPVVAGEMSPRGSAAMDRRTFINGGCPTGCCRAGVCPGRQAGNTGWTRDQARSTAAARRQSLRGALDPVGGPHRNFQTQASGIKDTWPATGPRVIWKRPLGEGYSSTIVENGVVYTMYGKPQAGGRPRRQRRDREDAVGTGHADGLQQRRAGDGQRPVLDAADRRRSPVHDRRRGPSPVPRQEVGQGAVDAAALDGPRRLAADVWICLEPDCLSRHRHRAGRRTRQGGHGVPAGRRQGRLGAATTSATSIRRRS